MSFQLEHHLFLPLKCCLPHWKWWGRLWLPAQCQIPAASADGHGGASCRPVQTILTAGPGPPLDPVQTEPTSQHDTVQAHLLGLWKEETGQIQREVKNKWCHVLFFLKTLNVFTEITIFVGYLVVSTWWQQRHQKTPGGVAVTHVLGAAGNGLVERRRCGALQMNFLRLIQAAAFKHKLAALDFDRGEAPCTLARGCLGAAWAITQTLQLSICGREDNVHPTLMLLHAHRYIHCGYIHVTKQKTFVLSSFSLTDKLQVGKIVYLHQKKDKQHWVIWSSNSCEFALSKQCKTNWSQSV